MGERFTQLSVKRGMLLGQGVRQLPVLLMQRVRGVSLGQRRLPARKVLQGGDQMALHHL
jgi:hypothetical protein